MINKLLKIVENNSHRNYEMKGLQGCVIIKDEVHNGLLYAIFKN